LRRAFAGDAYEDRDLVFADKLGGVIYPNRLTDWFTEHRKAAGIPVHIVAARLGDDPKTVLGTYAHLLPQSDELAAERVAMAIAG